MLQQISFDGFSEKDIHKFEIGNTFFFPIFFLTGQCIIRITKRFSYGVTETEIDYSDGDIGSTI